MSKDLEVLRMRLKSGEYDGVHIMKAWIAIEELIQLREELEALKVSIPEIQGKAIIEKLNLRAKNLHEYTNSKELNQIESYISEIACGIEAIIEANSFLKIVPAGGWDSNRKKYGKLIADETVAPQHN
jgi:hypothetical protein